MALRTGQARGGAAEDHDARSVRRVDRRRDARDRAHEGRRPVQARHDPRLRPSLRLRVYPTLGDVPFYRVRRVHLQDLVDRLVAGGVAPATINTTVGALGAIYARAVHRDELDVSPTTGVKVPAARNGRERFATPDEAARLLEAVPERDRAVWSTAMYAGLRRGELMALRWTDIDLKAGAIDVRRSWDPEHGPGETKNRNRRRVPIAATLREQLAAERLRQPHGAELCFGLAPGRPFRVDRLQQRADEAWKGAGLPRLTLHDCRHTFASFAIAAGVNAKALSSYIGPLVGRVGGGPKRHQVGIRSRAILYTRHGRRRLSLSDLKPRRLHPLSSRS